MKKIIGLIAGVCFAVFAALPVASDAGIMTLLGVGGGSAAPPTTTWNPSDKSANVTLDATHLITGATAFAFNTVRSVASHAGGKYYFEDAVTIIGSSIDAMGFANSTESLGNQLGSTVNSISYQPNSGLVTINGATVGTAATTGTNGDTIGIALDIPNSAIWIRVNGGNWNNSGTANPATNVGGFSLSTFAGGPYFAADQPVNTTTVHTANFGATAYVAAAPSGFGNL